MEPEIKIIKLVTGETLIANIEYDKMKKNATLKDPLVFSIVPKTSGKLSMTASRWIESSSTQHKIKTYHIVIAAEPTELMEQMYIDSVQEMNEYDSETVEYSEDDDVIDYLDSLQETDKTDTLH